MNSKYSRILLIALCTLGSIAIAAAANQKLVTIVTAADAQTQLMAMVLTMQAVQQGADAHILLCGPAADIALKAAPDSALARQKPKGMSPQGLMSMILTKTSATVEVCAIYLPNAGLDATALIDSVTAAEPQVMGARLIADDTRILSF